MRNNIEKSNLAGKPRCLTVAGKQILWTHFVNAYKFDQTKTSIHIHERLKEEHFNLDPALRMRNHLAEDVLDKKMHFLMMVMANFILAGLLIIKICRRIPIAINNPCYFWN